MGTGSMTSVGAPCETKSAGNVADMRLASRLDVGKDKKIIRKAGLASPWALYSPLGLMHKMGYVSKPDAASGIKNIRGIR
ncbi:hypothetical protein JCM14124_06680 [Humidesulfovibrio idahonensis]